MSKPICTVMVGLPATGKSTRVDALATMNPNVFVYSTDSLLEEWAAEEGKTYDEVFSELISDATGAMNSALDVAVRERLDIVWDQTNLGAKKRAKIIRRMRQAGYTVECECVLFPQGDSQQEDWQHRLASRPGKTIPANIVESMMDSFVMPAVEEGFDSVYYFDMYGNLID